jgi:hypothetical protein
MNYQKRGVLLVIFLFLVVLMSFSVFSGWEGHCTSPEGCVGIVLGSDACDGCDPSDGIASGSSSVDCNGPDTHCKAYPINHANEQIPETGNDYCVFGGDTATVPNEGCRFVVGEWDPAANDDDCGAGLVKVGNKWGNSFGEWGSSGVTGIQQWGGDNDVVKHLLYDSYIDDGWEYICADTNLWQRCVNGDDVGKVTWANDILYNCTRPQGTFEYVWEEVGEDKDRDGWTVQNGDCKDDHASDLEKCPQIDLTLDDFLGFKKDEHRQEVQSICNFPLNSECSICINPGAPEVCGDGLNNDCRIETGEPLGTEDTLTNPNSDTSDDCHMNGDACRQEVGPVGDPDPDDEPDEPDPDDPDDDNGDQEPQPILKAYNIYNEDLSWIETSSGGYCCGFNGSSDLGVIQTQVSGEGSEGEFICLNDNLVGRSENFEGFPDEENRCGADWCWVNSIGDAKFRILTLRRLGEKPIDAVSNNDKWFICDGNIQTLPEPISPEDTYEDDKRKTNRFYCYDEGNRWSFAECSNILSSRKEQGVKGRFAGEGLFALPMKDSDEAEEIKEERVGKEIVFKSRWYKDFYDENYYLDFSGYQYFNFMVQFVDTGDISEDPSLANPINKEDVLLPAGISLKILGPDDENDEPVIYYDSEVLGYVINSPFFNEDNFMHVKVPLTGDYKVVDKFLISINNEAPNNNIKVKNIYLSNDDQNSLCSGQDGVSESSWLNNTDSGSEAKEVSGEDLCTSLYGSNAWLGLDEEVDNPSASCCGNVEGEYYAGSSKDSLGAGNSSEDAKKYGCWNSNVVGSGETIMDVSFNVNYQEKVYNVSYTDANFNSIVNVRYAASVNWSGLTDKNVFCHGKVGNIGINPCDGVVGSCSTDCKGQYNPGGACSWTAAGNTNTLPCDQPPPYDTNQEAVKYEKNIGCSASINALSTDETLKQLCTFTIKDFPSAIQGKTDVWFSDLDDDRLEAVFFDLVTNEILDDTISSKSFAGQEYIHSPSMYIDQELAQKLWYHPLAVIVKLKDGAYFDAEVAESEEPRTAQITYSCTEDECLYPLPGLPPYTITNSHPELYELYFVTGSQEVDEKLITQPAQPFQEYGNLKARKIAQQILFFNEGDEANIDAGFYGCQAADFLELNLPPAFQKYNNNPYCSIIGDHFCAFSVQQESAKEKFTTINSWSQEVIAKVGYEAMGDPDDENISLFYNELQLQLKDRTFQPERRNHTAFVLPARNFISNAEFLVAAKELPHWEIVNVGGVFEKDEKQFIEEETRVVLPFGGQKLRTERIAVPQGKFLHFSQKHQCNPTIILVDKNGLPSGNGNDPTNIDTGDASYIRLEFPGPCQVEEPMLQLLDDLGAQPYYYNSQPDLENFDGRSGASCCPESYCWNGYACVEPMTELTSLTEHVDDGRDYRCVDGQWKESILKWDWNNQKWGFCTTNNQCFVLSSKFADEQNTAASFYEGNYPTCVNNSEYIFDHLCEEGEWSSRTKFLATKLIEVAENDDYVLYCSPYRDTLLDFQNKENYIGGDLIQVEEETQSLGEAIEGPAEQELLATCFSGINDPEGKRLVRDKDNTCVNNVCVLRYKEGGKFKVAFGTTLNKPVDSESSFLIALNVPQTEVGNVCTQGDDFLECDLSNLDFPSSTDLYYSSGINSIIFAKEGIKLSPGLIDKILDWFANLFTGGGKLSEESKFITEAQNFNDLYILKQGEKSIRAVQEIFPGVKQTLVAEYENFDSPVCEYVNNIKVPPEAQTELLEEVSDIQKFTCSQNDSIQKVEMVEGLDFFWPQLTGRLRLE